MTGDLLTALGAALACGLELLEALAIVVAVGVSRSWEDALAGAGAAVLACAALAAVAAPVLSAVPIDALRLVIGTLLLLFGLEWLRKATLRLGGVRARSSSAGEFEETREELSHLARPERGADWAARAIAFKGVLLEGVEVVLIVATLASRPSGPGPAIAGAAVAVAVVVGAGAWLRRPLERIPETELKWGVGVLLTAFGTFFAAEGLGAEWPGGDAALLYVAAALAAASQLQARRLRATRTAVPA
jgi:uncharacterized membrane protein